jgi:hypothetical protein
VTTATVGAGSGIRHRLFDHRSDADGPFVSVDDLATAYAEQGRANFTKQRKRFEQEHGNVVEHYFASDPAVGAVLVRPHKLGPLGGSYQIMVAHTRALPRPLTDQLRTVLHEKHRLASRVHGRARDIVVHDTYSLVVYLLAAVGPSTGHPDKAEIASMTKIVQRELACLRRFAKDAARRTALWFYLMGLALGAAIGIGLIVSAYHSKTVDSVGDRLTVAACLAGGAMGAVISVMVRVTRGTTLDVDSTRGRGVLLLAGSFRPVIGAVFGAVLLVLAHGGLLPFQPVPGGSAAAAGINGYVCFFIGLAFLAGFSERWAQDTIVSSAPKVPPARRSEPTMETDVF